MFSALSEERTIFNIFGPKVGGNQFIQLVGRKGAIPFAPAQLPFG